MRRRAGGFDGRAWLFATLFFALSANSAASVALSATERADDALRQWASENAPGVVAAIAVKDRVLWTGAAGCRRLSPCTPADTADLYGIGSITKPFIAVIIHQLVDEGKLELEMTPEDVLGAKILSGVANADRASLKTLMNHTSGIPSWEDTPEWRRRGRGDEMEIGYLWSKAETLDYIRGADHPAMNPPGAAFAYSNTNYTILGLIIEAVTKRDLISVLEERILKPLGLENVKMEGFQPIELRLLPDRYHVASPQFRADIGVHNRFPTLGGDLIDVSVSNLSHEWAAGGLMATASDLAQFAIALRNGALLSPEGQSSLLSFYEIHDNTAVGQGVFRTASGDVVMIGHQGGALGFNAYMAWLEDEDIAIVLLSNLGTIHSGAGETRHVRKLLETTGFLSAAIELARQADEQQ